MRNKKLNFRYVYLLLRNIVRDERGQSTTEYILMLAVVVMIAMKFKTTFLSQMDGIVQKVSGNINTVVSETQ